MKEAGDSVLQITFSYMPQVFYSIDIQAFSKSVFNISHQASFSDFTV